MFPCSSKIQQRLNYYTALVEVKIGSGKIPEPTKGVQKRLKPFLSYLIFYKKAK